MRYKLNTWKPKKFQKLKKWLKYKKIPKKMLKLNTLEEVSSLEEVTQQEVIQNCLILFYKVLVTKYYEILFIYVLCASLMINLYFFGPKNF